MARQQHQTIPQQQAPTGGYDVPEWCVSARISKAGYYVLPEDCKPESVKIGKRRIIIEAPAAWLQRMAARGGVAIPQRRAA